MDVVYDFGARMRELRDYKRLTQEELAKRVEVSKSSIYRYESNLQVPDAQTITRLAIVLETTTDYLLGMPHAPAIKYYDLHREQMDALQLFADFIERQLHVNTPPNGGEKAGKA